MTRTWLTMPTAVMTESSENTMSSSMICSSTLAKEGPTLAEPWPSSPSSFSWISMVLFAIRKRPPRSSTRSRPERSWPSTGT